MRFNNRGKFFAIFILLIFIFMSFVGVNIGSNENPGSSARAATQPYNSFKPYIWGGDGEKLEGKFGWNSTYIENLNGDQYPDLVVGTPWYFSGTDTEMGAVYVYYGKAGFGFDNLNHTSADAKIIGEGLGGRFGWDVADAGDVNGDGINDLIVGGPGALNGRGKAYIFFGGSLPSMANQAERVIEGLATGDNLGMAVSGIGDVNNDGYDDVMAGAPKVDYATISYGYKDIITMYPDIWDDNVTSPNLVAFEDGVNNTPSDTNTWGRGAGNDGWDWIDNIADGGSNGLYGGSNSIDGVRLYAAWEPDGPDADGLALWNRTSLEVCVGRTHTTNNNYGGGGWNNPGGSGAWGIEFEVTQEMFDIISTNGSVKVGFDYAVMDTELIFGSDGTEEAGIILSRIWNTSGRYYIGDVYGTYVFYHSQGGGQPAWGPVYDSFEWDISDFIDRVGTYYWDFGCYLGRGRFGQNEGVMGFFDNITMEMTNIKNTIVQGAKNSGFGSSVTAIGDIDNDNYDDFMVGAPYLDGGHVALIKGRKRFKLEESISIASLQLTGKKVGDRFGSSISLAGDVDNDNAPDVIIGAPGGDYANLYYGKTLKDGPIVPNLWEKINERNTPILEFNTGVETTGNTPGIFGADDGWDSWDGPYHTGGTPGSSTRFNYVEAIDSFQIALYQRLIVAIGSSYGGGSEPDSGAYGVEFTVNSNMKDAIDNGGDVVVSYDWEFADGGLDGNENEEIWIYSYLRNGSGSTHDLALGWNLDGAGKFEVFHLADPVDANDFFIQGAGDYFTKTGSYYVDFGGRVERWENGENGVFYFDNFGLYITPPPDIKFIGTTGSGFGTSVGYCDHLNIDDYGDIIVGAPYYDSPNGVDSGAVYGFFTGPSSEKVRLAQNAEFVTYGENADDNFGYMVAGGYSFDADIYDEIVVGAINYDSGSTANTGRVYIYSITKIPRIRLIHPVGGEILMGEAVVNATVTDPDDNIDTSLGIHFYYSTDLSNWNEIGSDTTPSLGNIFESNWDTTTLPDGANYYVKAWVQDLNLNKGENISAAVTIDNPHPPELNIQNPVLGGTIEGNVEIKAFAKDSNLDLIGGGINTTEGVKFYFSDDMVDWELVDTANTGVGNVYTVELDTTPYPDGEYWIKVNATDFDGYEVDDIINVTIDNPARPPSITLLSPIDKPELAGPVFVSATAFDFDLDINSSGVTFLISSDNSPDYWWSIGNDPTPEVNATGDDIYSMTWDTIIVNDGWYRLKAFVNDSEGLTNESIISEFAVHNNEINPPEIKIINPLGGQVVDKTQMITARVRDLEGNVDPNGVFFYYSADKVDWQFIGNVPEPRANDIEYYDLKWFTDTISDGEYWLNATIIDTTGLKSWDLTDEPIIVHNTNENPPILRFLTPTKGQSINGTFDVRTYAFDMENDIDKTGVTISYSTDEDNWMVLSNVESPAEGDKTYIYSWDTTQHEDGKYYLRATATDRRGDKGEAYSDYFFIHNNQNNPPIVDFLFPNSGELNGSDNKISASVFDLENNLDENGVSFYYSVDKNTWNLIGSDPTGTEEEDINIYDFNWDTNSVPDGYYWLRARARDKTDLIGFDISDEPIMIHNRMDNPPKVTILAPEDTDQALQSRESIIVDVQDFDDDINNIKFFYSKDNKTWESLGSISTPSGSGTYKMIWSTEEVENGNYYIKVEARDELGNPGEDIKGPFKVTQGKPVETGKRSFLDIYSLISLILIIVIIIIMILVIMLILRRSKKREKELIEEVAADLQQTQTLEGEIESTPAIGTGIGTGDAYQTYIPPSGAAPEELDVETIESYKAQMDAWRAEGYNVSRLEQMYTTDQNMFGRAFPVFSSNVSRLRDISTRLDSMDTTGYEVQVESIRAKQFEPDQALVAEREFKDLEIKLGIATPALGTAPAAGPGTTPELPQIDEMLPQLMPATPSTTGEDAGAGAVPEQTDVPADVELPPDIDLPPADDSAGIPESPYAEAKTESLEEEMGKDAAVAESPQEPDVTLPPEETEQKTEPTKPKESEEE